MGGIWSVGQQNKGKRIDLDGKKVDLEEAKIELEKLKIISESKVQTAQYRLLEKQIEERELEDELEAGKVRWNQQLIGAITLTFFALVGFVVRQKLKYDAIGN